MRRLVGIAVAVDVDDEIAYPNAPMTIAPPTWDPPRMLTTEESGGE
jgi:hypothetical protein